MLNRYHVTHSGLNFTLHATSLTEAVLIACKELSLVVGASEEFFGGTRVYGVDTSTFAVEPFIVRQS